MGEYLIGAVGGREVAGMMAQSPETVDAPSMWTIYFFVDDLDAAVGRVTAAGGSVFATPVELGDDVPNSWSVYFTVADCAASEAAARDLGGQVIKGSTPTPMGPFAVIADPQGAVFQLMEFTESSP